MDIPKMILLIFCGTGGILVIIAVCLAFAQNHKINVCTSQTNGTVVKYSYANSRAPIPIVEYSVEGITYLKRRRYRGVITTSHYNILKGINPDDFTCYIDDKDWIHIKYGAALNVRSVADRLFPLGKQMSVFYNPNKPKQSIVEQIPKKKPIGSIICFWMGIGFTAIGLLINLSLPF